MAAMASAPPWIPEDDILLKNAMEAGASLEALAKGAVRFSRKLSFRDLRERWHSLLYDADVWAEASVRMLEFEACNSNVPSKFNRFSQFRGSSRKHKKAVPCYEEETALIGTCADATPNSITKGLLNEEEINVPGTVAELSTLTAELGSPNMVFPKPHTNPSALDCEESEEDAYEDVDDDDEDADIPYFSDIEMMILEKLRWIYVQLMRSQRSLDESQSINMRMLKGKLIIRLEQYAQSSMQRALASKGTLVVLYDHHVKHYIKKTEVIIGRTTDDNQVDIDLGDNKVSRGQACWKFEGRKYELAKKFKIIIVTISGLRIA